MEDEDDSGFGPELEWDEEAFSQVDALSQPFFPGSYPRTAPDAAPAAHPALASTSSAARAPSAATDGQDVGPVAKTLPTHVAIAYETPPAPAPSAANLDPSAVDDLVVSTVAEPGLDLADDDGAEGIDTVEEPVETRSLYDRFRKRRRYLSGASTPFAPDRSIEIRPRSERHCVDTMVRGAGGIRPHWTKER